MMNKQQVFNLIGNRIWIYQSINKSHPNPTLFVLAGDEEASKSFLSIRFHKDGHVSAATKVGFFPNEFAKWDFNENTQELIFINQADQTKIHATLPYASSYGVITISLKNEPADSDQENQFVNDPHYDHLEISKRTLGGEKVFITPQESFDYFLRYDMRWLGFNIKLIDPATSLTEFFSGAYNYLVTHPHLKEIVISQKSKLITELPQTQHLLFLNNQGAPSFEYLSGERSAIMELLIMILSENNLRLFDDNDQRDELAMLQDILTSHFQGRYELKNLPEF
ncbi:hypothetical protein GBO86_03575 [Pediococcus acidilactici]|nr:hypothetical protein GBO86_03575 [Pediococcus acidilactici]